MAGNQPSTGLQNTAQNGLRQSREHFDILLNRRGRSGKHRAAIAPKSYPLSPSMNSGEPHP